MRTETNPCASGYTDLEPTRGREACAACAVIRHCPLFHHHRAMSNSWANGQSTICPSDVIAARLSKAAFAICRGVGLW